MIRVLIGGSLTPLKVIKGWDEGLLDMCPGEKRKLTIQPDWGYGSRSVGPIPADSVLGMCQL